MKKEFITNTPEETEKVAFELARTLKPSTVITMYGDLGAGKTAFTRGLASGLGSKSRVTSPTFTIVNEYEGNIPLFHFDMYRLGSSDELFDIGWEDYLAREGVCVVEWSENVEDAFDGTEMKITIEKLDENSRKITIEGENLC